MLRGYYLADIAVDVASINHMIRCGSSQLYDQRGAQPGTPNAAIYALSKLGIQAYCGDCMHEVSPAISTVCIFTQTRPFLFFYEETVGSAKYPQCIAQERPVNAAPPRLPLPLLNA